MNEVCQSECTHRITMESNDEKWMKGILNSARDENFENLIKIPN